jgi:hypothetical protein
MGLDFTVVVNVRNQFGDNDLDIGVFAGREKSFTFDCPSVSSGRALLLFQSLGVGPGQTLEVNGEPVFGGVPATDAITGSTGSTGGPSPPFDIPNHTHSLLFAITFGWVGNVLLISQGVLRDSGNVLRIASDGDNFVVDNVVVLYKSRTGVIGPVIDDASLAT